MTRTIISFDVETTGLDYLKDDIIEFYAIKTNGKKTEHLHSYVYSDKDCSYEALSKHHLTKTFLQENGYANRALALDAILSFLLSKDVLLVGQNIAFDMTMLICNAFKEGIDEDKIRKLKKSCCFDTMYADKILNPNVKGHSLAVLASRYHDIPVIPDHSAKHDAISTMFIALQQIKMMNKNAGLTVMNDKLHDKIQKYAIKDQTSFNEWLQSKDAAARPVGWPYFPDFEKDLA